MATLRVRSVPEDLYQKIQKLAKAHNRSLSAQVVTMLIQELEDEQSHKANVKN